MMPEKDDTIMLPVVPAIPDMLSSLNEKKEKFGIKGYSFAVEQLEDVLVRILQK